MLVCWYGWRLHLLVVSVTGRVQGTRLSYHIMSLLLHGPVVHQTAAFIHLVALDVHPVCFATSHAL